MRVGFITMHRVNNCGSVLQAYALQKMVSQLGYDVEIIDYHYVPPVKPRKLLSLLSTCVDALKGFPKKKQRNKFVEFRNELLRLTANSYDRDSIVSSPPSYDIYMTGSDQVWNPRFIKDDTNFMLSFVGKDKKKISYSSSFACKEIPKELETVYAKALAQFRRITVRETAALSIVKRLTGRDAEVVCDPVFLLSRDKWDQLIGKNRQRNYPYILVYVLGYMFNPWPNVYAIIETVQKSLGYKVIFLNGKRGGGVIHNSEVVKDYGPIEFLQWIRYAKFVVTDSFHCTSFSLIYNRPVWSVVEGLTTNDSRLRSLLEKVGAANSIIPFDSKPELRADSLDAFMCNMKLLESFRTTSAKTLEEMLKD